MGRQLTYYILDGRQMYGGEVAPPPNGTAITVKSFGVPGEEVECRVLGIKWVFDYRVEGELIAYVDLHPIPKG